GVLPRSSASGSSTIAWSCTASPSTATAEALSDSSQLRAAIRSLLLLLLFATVGPIHVVTKVLFRRSGWPRRFLAAAAWIVGARSADHSIPGGHDRAWRSDASVPLLAPGGGCLRI